MRWDPGHRSNDVIDRRGQRASGIGGGGGGAGLGLLLMLVRSRFGWAGVAVLLVGYFVLTSFTGVLDSGGGSQGRTQRAAAGDQRARQRQRAFRRIPLRQLHQCARLVAQQAHAHQWHFALAQRGEAAVGVVGGAHGLGFPDFDAHRLLHDRHRQCDCYRV